MRYSGGLTRACMAACSASATHKSHQPFSLACSMVSWCAIFI